MTILTIEKSRELIRKLQANRTTQQEERLLMAEIELRYKPHKIENYLYDASEMKQEFLLTSWNALYRAKLNIGDPIAFAVRRGNGSLLDYYRKVSRKKLFYICIDCGHQMSYDHRISDCRACGGTIRSEVKESLNPNFFETQQYEDDHFHFEQGFYIESVLREIKSIWEREDELLAIISEVVSSGIPIESIRKRAKLTKEQYGRICDKLRAVMIRLAV